MCIKYDEKLIIVDGAKDMFILEHIRRRSSLVSRVAEYEVIYFGSATGLSDISHRN